MKKIGIYILIIGNLFLLLSCETEEVLFLDISQFPQIIGKLEPGDIVQTAYGKIGYCRNFSQYDGKILVELVIKKEKKVDSSCQYWVKQGNVLGNYYVWVDSCGKDGQPNQSGEILLCRGVLSAPLTETLE